MLRLFSSVRNKYIAEGHLTRYFWYALGEIVLVMIGILLALQVNNWNEDRVALNETKNYLTKKLANLDEDLEQLEALTQHRLKLHGMCKQLLDTGYDNSSDYDIVSLVLLATIERRFVSAVTNNQRDNTTTYYKNIAGTGIEDLEQYYVDVVNFITFTEGRLNTASESLEEGLWSSGYFTDNRELFGAKNAYTKEEFDTGIAPKLRRDGDYPMGALLGIIRRNEISSIRLTENYADLMKINNELQDAIKQFLAN